jgi:hypothetical protein
VAHRFYERLAFFEAPVDFLSVIEVVGQRRMYFRQLQVILVGNVIGGLAQPLVPDRDILDRNPASGDARLPPATPGVISI